MKQASHDKVATPSAPSILAPPFIHSSRLSAVKNARILIVDDDRIILKILELMLHKAGFTNIHSANNGMEALEMVRRIRPDLMLLDLYMPDMNGMEVCDRICTMHLDHPPAVLVQTASSDEEHIVKAFEHGAIDYITKPVRDVEMVTRCIAHIERRHLEIDRTIDRRRMRSELEDAAKLQYDLLPSKKALRTIAERMELDIASQLIFSSEMGGDLWGIRQVSDGQLALYTVDVTGHGLKSALHTFRIHSLTQDHNPMFEVPDSMLYLLNNKLHDALPTGQFATMLCMLLDRRSNMLHYSTAAAPLPLIVRSNGDFIELEGSGLPLGCSADSHYQPHQVPLQSGDTILVYSDALFEAVPNFSEDEVIELMRDRGDSAQSIIDHIMKAIFERTSKQSLEDDLTLIAVKVP